MSRWHDVSAEPVYTAEGTIPMTRRTERPLKAAASPWGRFRLPSAFTIAPRERQDGTLSVYRR